MRMAFGLALDMAMLSVKAVRMDTAKDGATTMVKDMALALVLTTALLMLVVMQMVLAKMADLETDTFLIFDN
jgi:hypothetical protein